MKLYLENTKGESMINKNEQLNQPPCSLFLQWHGDSDPADWDEPVANSDVTWAEDRIFCGDVQYIRADLVREMRESTRELIMADRPTEEKKMRLRKAWERIRDILENRKDHGHE